MVLLKVLSGKMAGTEITARHFPFLIGRYEHSGLQLEDEGVWDRHLEIGLDSSRSFVLKTMPGALAAINGQPVREATLRNGDMIEIGAAKLSFWLAATRQSGLKFRESIVWALVGAVTVSQFYLIYFLLR